ncbi:hypothetical protein GCM10011394_18830 [Luteimonas terricola]|uniref:DUF1289 domain-containing protein n=1 Tax=Luteimonas terricola TaxID=645597 RepID=A0ABQ2EFS4_9GAMM|nr:hypothetical protein GCM10011394_18830 [Luteimonas terricola]
MSTDFRAVQTPCIGVCTINDDGLCDGCLRTGDEIAGWLAMEDAQREQLMDLVLPAREARRA